MEKLIAVIPLAGQNQLAVQGKRFQQRPGHTDVIAVSAGEQKTQWIPKPIRYRMDFRCQTSPAPSRFFVVSPFFSPTGVLMDFDRGAVQHQRRFVHQLLLD